MTNVAKIVLLALLMLPLLALANRPAPPAPVYQQTVAGYQVHFNVMPTSDLQPEVARRNNISRSENLLLVNLHVRKDDGDGGLGEARRAEVTATARTLIGQRREISLREIDDGDTVYYIGTLRKTSGDRLIFDLNIKPEDARRAFDVRFERDL